jgi:hypothetical protein
LVDTVALRLPQQNHNRTYAQRVNHYLFLPLDCSLTLLNVSEEEYVDNTNLKSLINRLKKIAKGLEIVESVKGHPTRNKQMVNLRIGGPIIGYLFTRR